MDLVGELRRDGVAPDSGPEPNVRLLRHYVSVGAVSRPERVGRTVEFEFRHLVEYVLVRVLLNDGWPLAKIAELLSRASLEVLLNYFDDHPPQDTMVDDARASRAVLPTSALVERASGSRAGIMRARQAQRSLRRSPQQSEALHATALLGVRSLDESTGSGRREVVRVEVEPNVVLEFAPSWLAELTRREIDLLSKRVRRLLHAEHRRRGGRK